MRNAVLHEALKRYCVEALTLLLRKPASIHLCSKESRRSADAGVVLRKVGSDDAREAPAARVSRSLRSPLRQRQWRHHTKNCAPGLAGSVQGGDRVEFDPVAMPRGPRADNVRR